MFTIQTMGPGSSLSFLCPETTSFSLTRFNATCGKLIPLLFHSLGAMLAKGLLFPSSFPSPQRSRLLMWVIALDSARAQCSRGSWASKGWC